MSGSAEVPKGKLAEAVAVPNHRTQMGVHQVQSPTGTAISAGGRGQETADSVPLTETTATAKPAGSVSRQASLRPSTTMKTAGSTNRVNAVDATRPPSMLTANGTMNSRSSLLS